MTAVSFTFRPLLLDGLVNNLNWPTVLCWKWDCCIFYTLLRRHFESFLYINGNYIFKTRSMCFFLLWRTDNLYFEQNKNPTWPKSTGSILCNVPFFINEIVFIVFHFLPLPFVFVYVCLVIKFKSSQTAKMFYRWTKLN